MNQKRNYFFKSSMQTHKMARLVAKAVDFFIVIILSVFLYPLGILLGIIYLCIADYIQGGQSVGKKIIGMKVISLEDGEPCSLKQSIKRNLPFIIPVSCLIVPIIGWLFAFFLGTVLVTLEIIILFKLDSGHRLGDVMADTSVVSSDHIKIKHNSDEASWLSPKKEMV
jgi:uncharacterized RDD family membrane protein YckC